MGNKTILIADDERALVQVMQLRCRQLGLKTLVAHDAVTALRRIREQRPDLACLDVEMPPGDGLSVCEELATDGEFQSMPVIIMTGCGDENTLQRCQVAGVRYVLKSNNLWHRVQPVIRELLGLNGNSSSKGASFVHPVVP